MTLVNLLANLKLKSLVKLLHVQITGAKLKSFLQKFGSLHHFFFTELTYSYFLEFIVDLVNLLK